MNNRMIDADEFVWYLTHWVDKNGFTHEVDAETFTISEIEDAIHKFGEEQAVIGCIMFLQSTGWMQKHDEELTECATKMTISELKAEADRQGYKLIKKTPYIKLERCPRCGKYPELWYEPRGTFYSCHEYNSEPCQSERAAKLAWNRMVSHKP